MTEKESVEQLVEVLAELRCIDSTVHVRVALETLAAFPGQAVFIEDTEGDAHFFSKRVLATAAPDPGPGTGVEVQLWAAPADRRRLRLVDTPPAA